MIGKVKKKLFICDNVKCSAINLIVISLFFRLIVAHMTTKRSKNMIQLKDQTELKNHVIKKENFISFRIRRNADRQIVSKDFEFNLMKKNLPFINIIRNQNLGK